LPGAHIPRTNILLYYNCPLYVTSVKNITYRFCNTNTLSLLVKTANFGTDGRFTTVDVQPTFHIQRVAMLKIRFQAKFCIPSPKRSSSPSHKLNNFSTRLSRCHFIFWGKTKTKTKCCLTQTERICMIYYHTSFHKSKVSDANVLLPYTFARPPSCYRSLDVVFVAVTLTV
jgi:hypothetical protein